jgi:LAO/AO transport system kinase
MADLPELFERAVVGDRPSLARLLTFVERGAAEARVVGQLAHARAGQAYVVGLTGAPGAGKSTLTDLLITKIRSLSQSVGVLAIDPTSPFSGGAILGDRVRMQSHATDDGVFIRSMATRGHLGGLAEATPDAVRVLDAAGFPWVIVETVGVGQVEVEIAGSADTTIVVVNPGWGDAVQAHKAGLLEVADIFVINKSDRPGVDDARRDLEAMLDLSVLRHGWRPTIVATSATEGTGVDELWAATEQHRAHLQETGQLAVRREQRVALHVTHLVARALHERANQLMGTAEFESLVHDVAERETDPWSAADQVLSTL